MPVENDAQRLRECITYQEQVLADKKTSASRRAKAEKKLGVFKDRLATLTTEKLPPKGGK